MSITFKMNNGDWIISSATGRIVEIKDREKLSQDLVENFTLKKQPNGFGADLNSLIAIIPDSSELDGGDIFFKVSVFENITDSIEAIKNLQDQYVNPARPDSELIDRISNINVQNSTNDKTAYTIRVDLATVDGETVTISGTGQT